MNNVFLKKIQDIRKNMKGNNVKAMEILSKLVPKPQTTFDFSLVKVITVYEIIVK